MGSRRSAWLVRDAMLDFFGRAQLLDAFRKGRLFSLRRMWTRSTQRARAQGVSGWAADLVVGLRDSLGEAWPLLFAS
eukprot:7390318-Prymnesium_polylepis.1